MNYSILLGLLFLILIARLRLTFRDEGIRRSDWLIIGGLPLLSLFFLEINFTWFTLLFFFPGMSYLLYRIEARTSHIYQWRLISLLIYIIVLASMCGAVGTLKVNAVPIAIVDYINTVLLPERLLFDPELLRIELYAFGLILVLNEMNILLRYILRLVRLEPVEREHQVEEQLDEEEYNTGRVIGMLERVFVFLFVLAGQYTAIGFILAAKGVTRFREFKNRTFAEYVLIGTLLSTLLAFLVAYFVRWLTYFNF